MDVILKQDVKSLGKKEDLVKVSDGYARNYLIPKGIVVEANAANINIMKSRKKAEENRRDNKISDAKALAQKLNDITVVIKAKAGENGKLFGSITNKDISDKLKADFKLNIDKKKISIHDAVKSLGTTEVEIKLYPNVTAKISLKVEQE